MANRHGRHALTDRRRDKLKDVISNRQADLTLVMENINDGHNLSAVLRSADSVGILKVHLLYHSGQEIPELKRSSSGSSAKWIETEEHSSVQDCFNVLRRQGMQIFTTHLTEDAKKIYDLDLTKPTALVFGNEHEGVSAEAVNMADGNMLIPQVGMAESLNISVACAVSVYEAFRQRLSAGTLESSHLDAAQQEQVFEAWSRR